jgi:hypothetical protein
MSATGRGPEDGVNHRHESSQKLARIRLVARTRMAWEQVRDASCRGEARSATRARARLAVLNRALALLALQG